MLTVWVALAIIAGQAALVGAVLWAVRSFGAYTRAVLKAQEENIAIQRTNFDLSDDLAGLRAELYAERAELARRRKQPPQSEDCVA